MEIKPGKFRTREWAESVVLEVYNNRAFGRYKSHNEKFGWVACDWSLSGTCFLDPALDLIAPWEEPKPRLRVWRRVSDFSTGNGDIKICYTKPMGLDDWQPVPELDALFERGKE